MHNLIFTQDFAFILPHSAKCTFELKVRPKKKSNRNENKSENLSKNVDEILNPTRTLN